MEYSSAPSGFLLDLDPVSFCFFNNYSCIIFDLLTSLMYYLIIYNNPFFIIQVFFYPIEE